MEEFYLIAPADTKVDLLVDDPSVQNVLSRARPM
jgi:hypothetical protein